MDSAVGIAAIAGFLFLLGLAGYVGFRRITRRAYWRLAIMGLALYAASGACFLIATLQSGSDESGLAGYLAFFVLSMVAGVMLLGVIIGAIYTALRPTRPGQSAPAQAARASWDVILFCALAALGLGLALLG